MSLVVPVILSGGSGSRLWPKSRLHYPKQLHKLYGDFTMLQHTLHRVAHLDRPIIICNHEQRFMVADQVQSIGQSAQIILEPVGRNTAPAIAVAALSALEQSPDAIIAVFAADHVITDQVVFREALQEAINLAEQNRLVTFGVVPTRAETGYGYVKTESTDKTRASKVLEFVEKPNKATAENYLGLGCYYWNSGMFVFSAQQLLEELTELQSDLVKYCKAALCNAEKDLDFLRLDTETFALCANISIDYALMEHTQNAWSVPLQAGWSDLGSWDAVWEISEKDKDGNSALGDVLLQESTNCLVRADTRLVTLLGVSNLVVIETADSILVADKNDAQKVKNIVAQLQAQNRQECCIHREVHRPWGAYSLVDHGERYRVNCISIKQGASMSLQMHHHRAEHWIVVEGRALVMKGGQRHELGENESIFVEFGEVHQISNNGSENLRLIEVQTGLFLSELDIVRLPNTALNV